MSPRVKNQSKLVENVVELHDTDKIAEVTFSNEVVGYILQFNCVNFQLNSFYGNWFVNYSLL